MSGLDAGLDGNKYRSKPIKLVNSGIIIILIIVIIIITIIILIIIIIIIIITIILLVNWQIIHIRNGSSSVIRDN